MNHASVTIGKKTYQLKFGYGVFRRLSREYKIQSFGELGSFIDSLELTSGKDLKFDALDFIGNLVKCSIEFNLKDQVDFDMEDVVQDLIFDPSQRDKLTEIIQSLFASFAPLIDSEKKPIPAQKKAPRKK